MIAAVLANSINAQIALNPQNLTLEQALAQLRELVGQMALGSLGRLSPLFLVTMVLIFFAIYLKRRVSKPFLSWAFPKKVYFHKSHLVDIKIFLFGRLLSLTAAISKIGLSAFISVSVARYIGGDQAPDSTWSPILIGLLLLVVSDFCTYWVHRIHHENTVLWPFHSVHHSAEILTPVTLYRKHPIYDLFSSVVHSVAMGIVHGILLGFFIGQVDIATVAGINAFYFAFNLVGSNIRHTHIWLSYGPFIEHIFISPSQHQVHHSIDPRHHNKNYGEVLAVWDWVFGSLYVTGKEEKLVFGLADGRGQRMDQIHPTFTRALIRPFTDSLVSFRKLLKR